MHDARFGTEKACHDFLAQIRWDGKPKCPDCGNDHMNYYLTTRNIYKCSECYKQFSVMQGTIFHGSKVSLKKWFRAIYFFTTKKRALSSVQMAEWLGVKQHTAWFMMQRLREALKYENNIVLNGIVETDESWVMPKTHRDARLLAKKRIHEKEQDRIHGLPLDKRRKLGIKFKRGRKKGTTKEVIEQQKLERGGKPYNSKKPSERIPFEQGAVVLGMMEQRGKLVMKLLGKDIRCIAKKNMLPLMRKHISAKSIIYTDELNKYDDVGKYFASHSTVKHKESYVQDGVHINNVENAWNHLKRMIAGSYFHMSYHHFKGYLNENTYRWNRREDGLRKKFEDFIPLVKGKKVTYKQIIKPKKAA